MQRDSSVFPDDDDGDILWRMCLAGDDISVPRNVNFSVLFEAEDSAESYAAEMREAAFEVQVDECLGTYEIPAWEAVTTAHTALSHERITALGDLISSIAASHGGFPDGWDAERSPGNSFKPNSLRGSA